MDYVIIVLLLGIAVFLWRTNFVTGKKLDQLIEVTDAQSKSANRSAVLASTSYRELMFHKICNMGNSKTRQLSNSNENTAGAYSPEHVQYDNLASIYTDYLERYNNIPQLFDQFFSSGAIEQDIEIRLEKTITPEDLYAPIYDLIVKQNYSGERDFAAELATYSVETYDEMVNRAALISKLEQLGVIVRVSGENWGDFLRFRIKSMDTDELKNMIYSEMQSEDDEYFDEKYNEGKLSRIFDAHHLWLIC